jgi:hypothetical protein
MLSLVPMRFWESRTPFWDGFAAEDHLRISPPLLRTTPFGQSSAARAVDYLLAHIGMRLLRSQTRFIFWAEMVGPS